MMPKKQARKVEKKKEKKKLSFLNIFTKAVLGFSIAVLGYAIFAGIIQHTSPYHNITFNPVIIIIGLMIFMFGAMKTRRFLLAHESIEKYANIIMIVASILYFVALCFVGIKFEGTPKFDSNHIIAESNALIDDPDHDFGPYLDLFSNQRGLFVLYYYIIHFADSLPFISSNHLLIIVNAACIAVTVFIIYKTVALHRKKSDALFVSMLVALFPALILRAGFPYSDTLTWPLVAIQAYLLGSVFMNGKFKALKLFVVGLLVYPIFSIRVPGLFLLIAYFVYLLVKTKSIRNLEQIIRQVAVISVGVAISFIGCKGILNSFNFNDPGYTELSPWHWLVMGSNTVKRGWYSTSDVEEATDIKDPKERKEHSKKTFIKRLGANAFDDGGSLVLDKVESVWSDADFGLSLMSQQRNYNELTRHVYGDKQNHAFLYYNQVYYLGIIIMLLIALIGAFKEGRLSPLPIAIFGMIVFYIFWETKPRYMATSLPWILLLIPDSFDAISEKLSSKSIKIFKKRINTSLLKRGLLVSVCLLLVVEAYSKCIYKQIIMPTALDNTDNNGSTKIEIYDQVVYKQEFHTDLQFNRADMYFEYDTKKDVDGQYVQLKIYDNNDKEIRSSRLALHKLYNKKTTAFVFKDVMPNEKASYFTLSTNAPLETKLRGKISYDSEVGPYDTIDGKFYINELKVDDGDYAFRLFELYERPIYTKKGYVVICAAAIGITWLALTDRKLGKGKRKHAKKA